MENERPTVYECAHDEYKTHVTSAGSSKFCLVHPSLEVDLGFDSTDAHKVTELETQCVHCNRQDRPTMKQVVKSLLKLRAARGYTHEFGIKKRAPASY